jgi:predicted nucleic acid-binding protein
MQQQYNAIIADTSCFILLDKINYLHILKELFIVVTTTTEVSLEFGKALPNWIVIENVKNIQQQQLLQLEIDKGEASAIALAIEKGNCLLVLDDFKARKLAFKLNLHFTGSLGIKESGIISELKPILLKIQETNFRFSDNIFNEILQLAGEK